MKKITKILSVILVMVLCMQSFLSAYASTTSTTIFNSSTYTHQTKFDGCRIQQGIDVSKHNGTIDWNAVKAAGVEFAIIRVGYRGYGSAGSLCKDVNFEDNMTNAIKAGIPIGVYIYSQSLNESEAVAEANYILEKIKPYKIQLPVIFDYEFADVETGRMDSAYKNGTLTKAQMTKNCIAFCDRVKDAGYTPMVYANKSFLTNTVDHTAIEAAGYEVWLAHYNTSTNYTGDFTIWQFTSTGKISGISGSVDCNFMYLLGEKDKFQVSGVTDKTYTGKEIKPAITVRLNGIELKKDEDYLITYENNIEVGKAKIIVTGCNDYAEIPSKTITFSILPKKVTGLKFVSRTTSSISIKWSANETADKYEVRVLRSGVWKVAGTTASTSFTVKDLYSANTYTIRVLGYKTVGGKKYYSANADIKSETTPKKVTGLSTSSRTTTSVTLKWTAQSATSMYRVYKYNTSKKKYETYKDIYGGKKNSIKITKLSANQSYKFKVKAYKTTTTGSSISGEMSSVYTAYTAPKSTSIKSVSSPSTKKMNLTWKKGSGISGYQVMWSTTSNFSSNYKTQNITGASNTSKTISLGQSKKKYYVKIRTYKIRNNKKIYSAWSEKKSFTSK